MNNIGSWENKMRDLSNEQSTPPPGIVWNNIEMAIKKDKKRKFIFLPIAIVSLLGLTVLGINYLNLNTKSSSITKTKIIDNKIAEDSNNQTNESLNTVKQTVSQKVESVNEKINKAESGVTNSSLKLNITNSTRKTGQGAILNSVINKNNHISNIVESNEGVEINKDLGSNKILNSTSSSIQLTHLDEFTTLHRNIKLLESKVQKIKQNFKISDDCPKFNKKKEIKFFVEVEGALGKPSKTMKDNPDNSGLYKYRNNSEDPWYTWGFGLHGGIMINNQWSINTGINFTQVKEKFTTTRPGYTVITIIHDPNGIPIDTLVQTGTLINEAENRYTLLDIPVTLGYEYKFNDWGLGLEAGVDFNLSLSTRGKIFNGSQDVLKLEDQKDIYKTSLGMGFHASIALSRYLTDNTSIYVKPGFRTYLKDWTLDSYPLSTNYNVFMLNIGIRHRF